MEAQHIGLPVCLTTSKIKRPKNKNDIKKEYDLKKKRRPQNENNIKNEDNVRIEDSLELKTHTAPPLRPSVVLVNMTSANVNNI